MYYRRLGDKYMADAIETDSKEKAEAYKEYAKRVNKAWFLYQSNKQLNIRKARRQEITYNYADDLNFEERKQFDIVLDTELEIYTNKGYIK